MNSNRIERLLKIKRAIEETCSAHGWVWEETLPYHRLLEQVDWQLTRLREGRNGN